MKKQNLKKLIVLGITSGAAIAAQGSAFAVEANGQAGTFLAAGCGSKGGCNAFTSGSPRDSKTAYETPNQGSCAASKAANGMSDSSNIQQTPSQSGCSATKAPQGQGSCAASKAPQGQGGCAASKVPQGQGTNATKDFPSNMQGTSQGMNPINNQKAQTDLQNLPQTSK